MQAGSSLSHNTRLPDCFPRNSFSCSHDQRDTDALRSHLPTINTDEGFDRRTRQGPCGPCAVCRDGWLCLCVFLSLLSFSLLFPIATATLKSPFGQTRLSCFPLRRALPTQHVARRPRCLSLGLFWVIITWRSGLRSQAGGLGVALLSNH